MRNANECSFRLRWGLMLLVFVAAGCAPKIEKPTAPEPATTKASRPITAPSPLPSPLLPRSVLLTGSLKAVREVAVSPRQDSQRVAAVLVREGESVRAGQVLARLDDRDVAANSRAADATVLSAEAGIAQAVAAYRQQVATARSTVASAEAGLNAARADLSEVRAGTRRQEEAQADATVRIAETTLKKAETDLARYERLQSAGAVALVEVEQYRVGRDVAAEQLRSAREAASLSREGARVQEIVRAVAAVRQAEEAVRQANAAFAQNSIRQSEIVAARAVLAERVNQRTIARQAVFDAVLRSPIGGRVSLRDIEVGQTVGTANTVFKIVAPHVRFEPNVPETDLRYLSVGQRVAVRVDALPHRPFAGRIADIAPTGQAQGRSFAVRIELSDPENTLRPGMFARAEVSISKVVLAPVAAKGDR
ncbi:MAG: efflux RND transporter periplasmic adaptor subunit [Akkermansiaceae bacterium]|nr:efflux RND transporter periplasmic adaptor subunit [Armatimonadota bacterium]